jgi:CubicO group peptidase (beta-lactamase class C family)
MTVDTVFDLASLTKVVATTSAVMALLEDGQIRLSDPVRRFWPEFGANGKEQITLRHLLTHTGGLAAGINFYGPLANPEGGPVQDHTDRVLAMLAEHTPPHPPNTRVLYTDLGFITLGEVVRRVTGEPLDQYVQRRIFQPLGLRETGYNPSAELCARAAPTTVRGAAYLQGQVHDPSAAVCRGVAGHAGLFSTAADLARFAEMLTVGRSSTARGGRYPLQPLTLRLMTAPQTPPDLPLRGLGWDIDSPFSHVKGDLMPAGSFGHTGFTGTYMWVEPRSGVYLIGLSNRVHPDGGGNPLRMWARAANVVSARLVPPLDDAPIRGKSLTTETRRHGEPTPEVENSPETREARRTSS